jgi:hypothetical protein
VHESEAVRLAMEAGEMARFLREQTREERHRRMMEEGLSGVPGVTIKPGVEIHRPAFRGALWAVSGSPYRFRSGRRATGSGRISKRTWSSRHKNIRVHAVR